VTRRATARALAFVVAVWFVTTASAVAHEPGALPALDFEPPAPGTYALQRIMAAPDGEVLDVDGRVQRLARFTHDRITLLGFVYTTCVDPEGCPLAYRVFDAVHETVAAEPALRDHVRLVTLSFDPARDTPGVMGRLRAAASARAPCRGSFSRHGRHAS
jgi:protein SCO1